MCKDHWPPVISAYVNWTVPLIDRLILFSTFKKYIATDFFFTKKYLCKWSTLFWVSLTHKNTQQCDYHSFHV